MVLRSVFSFRSKKLTITIFTISFLIFNLSSAHVFSQSNLPNNELILGVRTIAPPIAGFCYAFKDTLQKYTGKGVIVKSVPILNQYKGGFYSRYIGLLKDPFDPAHIDIECGPNSTSSSQLINQDSKKYFLEDIRFSKPFYTTGIKLLLREEIAQNLSKSSLGELEENLSKLKIGVIQDTSTLMELKNNKIVYQVIPLESIKDSDNPNKGINALERTLRSLDNNGNLDSGSQIDALASDAIILQSLLKTGVDQSGEKGEFAYIKKRPGYEQKNYRIFPSKEFPSPDGNIYLPRLSKQNYAIAIRKGAPNESWLSRIISNSLDDLSIANSKLKKAKDILQPFEMGEVSLPSQSLPDPSNSPVLPTPAPLPNSDKWWIPLMVAGIGALGTIITAILKPEFFSTIINWKGGRQENPQLKNKRITGRVLNVRTGAWISRAKVSLEANGTPPIEYTDSQGIFVFTFQSSSDLIRLRVEAEGYAMFDQRIELSNSGKIEEIMLSPDSKL